jgi:hypothetical protein
MSCKKPAGIFTSFLRTPRHYNPEGRILDHPVLLARVRTWSRMVEILRSKRDRPSILFLLWNPYLFTIHDFCIVFGSINGLNPCIVTKYHDQVGTGCTFSGLYLRDARFESRPVHSYPDWDLRVFSQSTKIPVQYLDRSLPHPFQFIIHYYPFKAIQSGLLTAPFNGCKLRTYKIHSESSNHNSTGLTAILIEGLCGFS